MKIQKKQKKMKIQKKFENSIKIKVKKLKQATNQLFQCIFLCLKLREPTIKQSRHCLS
jgi:hypothetical protein